MDRDLTGEDRRQGRSTGRFQDLLQCAPTAKRIPARIVGSSSRTRRRGSGGAIASVQAPANGAPSPSATLSGWIWTTSFRAIARLTAFERTGFDAVDPDRRASLLERGRDPADQPAATDPDDHDVQVGLVLEQLQADRAVTGDHRRVVERVDEPQAIRVADPLHLGEGLADVGAMEDHPGAIAKAGIDLRPNRARGHDDGDGHAGRSPGPRVRLARIAGRQRDRRLAIVRRLSGSRSGWSSLAA